MKIFDLHCDTLYKFFEECNYSISDNNGHISEKTLVKGEYFAQCFAIYIPQSFVGESAFEFFKNQYKTFSKILKSSQLLSLTEREKIIAILTLENAELLNGKTERINYLENLGVKILGLIHNGENCLGFPHSSEICIANKPLKKFGREAVEYLNNTDIIADVSHLNLGGFNDVANISTKPFVATHSGCRELLDHSRNLYDFQIKAIANSGGIVGVPFYSKFLNGTNETKIDDIIRHLEHLIKVGGEDIAAIGSDFDGIECELPFSNAGDMQVLAHAIIKKFGISKAEKICYKNALRILE